MFITQFGVFWIVLLYCCKKSEAKLSLKNRITVALAGKTVTNQLEVTIPANSSNSNITCYQNSYKVPVWRHPIDQKPSTSATTISLSPNISMHTSSCSGEYYFQYKDERLYWVVLVRDEYYVGMPHMDMVSILLLVVLTVLLLLNITGSVYIFKMYKVSMQYKKIINNGMV
ncbi:uncharacterized protein si:ch211-243a20.4 [Neoarius graeffei]|uniref:uncharacterized protein si:ch211-243a20.4 n=1 Tax=Neoarius graeffei TaxID=443677 RepID=UPI00298CC749|nr:uncharacterized protein si:ch211-243a20.4 [Neoarius graeffei]